MKLTPDLMLLTRELIAQRVGLDLSPQRQEDLERAIAEAVAASAAATPEAYVARLRNLPGESSEWRRLAGALTVGETYFFRDTDLFEAVENHILPDLIAERRAHGMLRLRIWSAGCATGEEPYSLAILLDRLLPDRAQWSLTILASDLNHAAIDLARRGFYRDWALRATPPAIRDRCFHRRDGGYQLDAEIRRMVVFAPLNLAEAVYPDAVTNTTAMDLILCRNVVMYFTEQARREAAGRLRRCLVDGGWLALSPAESSADLLRPLMPISLPGAIFYRKDRTYVPAAMPVVATPAAPFVAEPIVEAVEEPAAIEPAAVEPFRVPDPVPDGELLARARSLADSGRLEEARSLCRTLLQTDRLNAEAHVLLAAIAQELGEIGPAMEALRGAIYIAPDSAAAHFLLGALLWRQGERRRGRRALEASVALLERLPADERVTGAGDLTAARLRQTALEYLEDIA